MKRASSFILVFVILGSTAVQAGNSTKEEYFNDCIAAEIEVCQFKAGLIDSKSDVLSSRAGKARARLEFYRANKELLAQEMLTQEIREKPYAVKYFLNKAYEENGLKTSGAKYSFTE